jgi:hypothetical protein
MRATPAFGAGAAAMGGAAGIAGGRSPAPPWGADPSGLAPPVDPRTMAPGPVDPYGHLPPPPVGAAPAAAPARARKTSAPPVPAERGAGRLFAVPYSHGPRALLGLLWAVALLPAAALGAPGLAALFGGVAACSAWGTARSWQRRGYEPDHRLAAGAAFAVSMVAAVHVSLAGVLLMGLPLVALLAAAGSASQHVQRPPVLSTVGATLRSVVPPCIAVIGVLLVNQSGLWVLLGFLGLVCAYDAGSFLIGAESRTPVVGIVGGVLCTVVAGVPLMVSMLPPFYGEPVGLVFAALIGVVAPLGQMVASLSLPAAAEWVGPLRRIDAYIVTAPLFAWVVARFLAAA